MALNRMIAAGKNRQWRLLTWLRPVFATLMALILPGCQSPFEQALTAPRERPNILFILTDDQRFDAMHCGGNALIQTPNIDRLAAEGVRFRNHFVTTSICCVSRASILTCPIWTAPRDRRFQNATHSAAMGRNLSCSASRRRLPHRFDRKVWRVRSGLRPV